MARHKTFPTLFDELIFISITKIKEWGYLNHNQCKTGTLTWSRNSNKTACIDIKVNTYEDCYIELEYKFRDEPVNYKVSLVKIPSNLGKGDIWYFVCPNTGKYCRKLFLIGKYFLHRKSAKGFYYEKQTYSKRNRNLYRKYKYLTANDKISKPYFKAFYNGKPTKRYLKLMNLVNQLRGVTLEQLIHI
jgi:hypothetical protein